MAKVYITDKITNPDIEKSILGSNVSTEFDKNVTILMPWNKIIDKAYIDKFTNLKSIIRCGIGYDLIDIKYARSKNISVSNVPDYCINEVADSTIGFILNIIRGLSFMDATYKTILPNSGWQEHLLKSLRRTSRYVVGVIGAGRIGSNVMKKLSAFDIECLYFDPYVNNNLYGKRINSLKELLANSDIISMHTPLTEETKGMINSKFISQMKIGASIVNTARGKLVDNLDIILENLKSKHLFSIGFDVLPQEPPIDCNLIKMWRNNNPDIAGRVLINPHSAFYSLEAYAEVREKASQNALGVLKGEVQLNVIN